jgi:hypothetical protein
MGIMGQKARKGKGRSTSVGPYLWPYSLVGGRRKHDKGSDKARKGAASMDMDGDPCASKDAREDRGRVGALVGHLWSTWSVEAQWWLQSEVANEETESGIRIDFIMWKRDVGLGTSVEAKKQPTRPHARDAECDSVIDLGYSLSVAE